MLKKAPLLSAALAVLLIFATTNLSFADAPDLLKQAEACTKADDCTQAEQIYVQILTDYPATEYAFEAQKGLTLLYVTWGKHAQAQASLDRLLSDFAGHKAMAQAIYEIGYRYRERNRNDKAQELHHYNVENFPDDMYAMWSQVEVICFHIDRENDAAADAAFDKLLTVFSQQPTLAKEVYQVARKYEQYKRYDKAQELRHYNVENFPNDMYAMWSQVDAICFHIDSGNDAAADVAFDRLLAVFSQQPTLPKEVYQVANKFSEAGNTQKAQQLYQYLIERWSVEGDFDSLKFVVMSHIALGDDEAAQVQIGKLLTTFPDQPNLSKEVYQMASRFSEAGNYDKACELYQYLIDTWSADADIDSRKFVVMSYISLGVDAEVQPAIEDLTEDFKDHPDLPAVLWQAAQAYYNEAFTYDNEGLEDEAVDNFTKVINLAERIIQEWPAGALEAAICQILGVCYERLAEYEIAIEYFKKVVDQYPDYEYAYHAQFMVGRMYQKLKEVGPIEPSEADLKTQQAYENVLTRYPDSKAARAAQNWLEWMTKESTY